MPIINGVINEVRPDTVISVNGAMVSSVNGAMPTGVDKWRMAWNGNHFAPPPVGSVLYYPGVPGQGTVLQDFSGSANDGTLTGATWVQLPSGLWVNNYDGNDYVDIDTVVADLAATTKGTWMTWVNLVDATPAATGYLIAFGDTDQAEYIYMRIDAAGKLSAVCADFGVAQWGVITDNAIVSDGVDAHLAIIQDGTSPVLVVNGVQVAQTFTNETNKTKWFADCTGLDNGRLGCHNDNSTGNAGFVTNGTMGLTTLVPTNLTVAQVLSIYQQDLKYIGV